MSYHADIFDYIAAQEVAYKLPIRINENWTWSMAEHIRLSVLYKNSQLATGKDDFKPVKNITRPILNLQYRAEGFDVKDITIFVNEQENYHKSFLVKKFHEKWALENSIDTFIDTLVESYVDFGGALVKHVNDVKPEVVPLQSIVFCDQTDILSGPIGIKHYFSPDQLLAMADKGWGNKKYGANCSLEEAIEASRDIKKDTEGGQLNDTPGRYVEVYEVHGNMPERFRTHTDSKKYEGQLFIGCMYQKKDGTKKNIVLFHMPETKSPFKFIARDAIYGRALGFGGAEELFEAQVWTNYDEIRKQGLKDAASKTILKASGVMGATIAQKNKVRDMENLQIIDVGPDGDLNQIDTFPRNIQIFDNSQQEWLAHAQQMGAANDSIMGVSPKAGTPFKLQELVTQESHSLHEYRKGKLATFIGEIYRDWSLPHFAKEIAKGQKFLAELTLDELNYVMDCIVRNAENNMVKEKILNGELIDPEEIEGYKEIVGEEFKRKGNKHFIEMMKDEMKGAPLDAYVSIVGKQKNLGEAVDKIVNIIRFLVGSNPMTLAFPGTWKLINQVVEHSGLDPVDFSELAGAFKKMAEQQQMAQQAQAPAPQQEAQPVI